MSEFQMDNRIHFIIVIIIIRILLICPVYYEKHKQNINNWVSFRKF